MRSSRAALLVLALVLLCPAALAPTALAAFPGANGKIVFSNLGTSTGYQLQAINPDGSGRANLFQGEEPAWSADGKKLAVAQAQDLVVSNADGTDAVQLTNNGPSCSTFFCAYSTDPTWSPGGDRLAYTHISCGSHQCVTWVRVINVDGTGMIDLTDTGSEPAWSPDGSRIAFEQNGGIVTLPPSGCCDYTYLTNSGSHPSWSPDGSRIAFSRGSLYTMNADGTNQVPLNVAGSDAAWSPDGSKLVFVRFENSQYDLYTVNIDGSGVRNITMTTEQWGEQSPDWQPSQGYARPLSATNMQLKFVPAYKPCDAPNAAHGPPLIASSCSPPEQASEFLTVGTPDANGAAALSQGSAGMKTICNPPAPNPHPPCTAAGDQADEQLQVTFTDVHQKTTLLDYAGELEARMTLRITDRLNGLCDGCLVAGTTTDVPFSFAVPCTTTPSATIGSTCSVTTTADSVMAGVVREGGRTIRELGPFEIYDGGTDGDADTPGDNTLFAVQGLFAP